MTSLALKDAIDSRLNYGFFFSKLNCVLFAQCIIFCRTNRAHWRSVIDSQLFMIKNKPRNSQRSTMTYLEDYFAISPDFLHFPTLKVLYSTEGNFLFGSSHCSWDHLANYSPPFWVNLDLNLSSRREGFLFVCLFCFIQVFELKSTRRFKAKMGLFIERTLNDMWHVLIRW